MSLLHGSIAESTRSSYDRGFGSYLVFVRQHGAAFPPSEHSLLGFATWLFTVVAKSAGTTRAYVTGLRGGCVELGYDVRAFEAPRLSRLYRGMARARRAVSRPRRLPITGALLYLIITKVEPDREADPVRSGGCAVLRRVPMRRALLQLADRETERDDP